MIRVILVDDEVLALKNLKHVLKQFEGVNIVAKTSNPLEALTKIAEIKPDVVFLDIEMPVINGFAVAEEILKLTSRTLVVFVTGYDEHAVKAFEINALDYILKPVTKERMARTLERIKENQKLQKTGKGYLNSITNASKLLDLSFDKVVGWKNEKLYLLDVSEILYLTSTGGEVFIITEKEQYKIRGTLKNWEERLSGAGFFRCHKGYVVNFNKVSVINPLFKNTFSLKLRNSKEEIPVSRRYAVRLKDLLQF